MVKVLKRRPRIAHLDRIKRRYKEGTHPHYDETLYSQGKPVHALKNAEQLQLMGEAELMDRISQVKAEIDAYEQEQDLAKEHIKLYKQLEYNRGNPNYQNVPNDLQKRVLAAEANIDVLKAKLDVFTEILAMRLDGPDGSTGSKPLFHQGHMGITCIDPQTSTGHVDGQQVSRINSRPTINDNRSPFDGMSVMDYKLCIVKPWKTEKHKLQKEYEEATKVFARREKLGEVTEKDAPRPKNLPLMKDWPEGVPNQKQIVSGNGKKVMK